MYFVNLTFELSESQLRTVTVISALAFQLPTLLVVPLLMLLIQDTVKQNSKKQVTRER